MCASCSLNHADPLPKTVANMLPYQIQSSPLASFSQQQIHKKFDPFLFTGMCISRSPPLCPPPSGLNISTPQLMWRNHWRRKKDHFPQALFQNLFRCHWRQASQLAHLHTRCPFLPFPFEIEHSRMKTGSQQKHYTNVPKGSSFLEMGLHFTQLPCSTLICGSISKDSSGAKTEEVSRGRAR